MNTLTPEHIDEIKTEMQSFDENNMSQYADFIINRYGEILTSLEMAKANADRLFQLKQLTDVQCDDGNWNYDPYMHGMTNGMIFSHSIMEGCEPKYKDAPDTWLADKPTPPKESE